MVPLMRPISAEIVTRFRIRQGLKPHLLSLLYAALKRRSSTTLKHGSPTALRHGSSIALRQCGAETPFVAHQL